jgi:hypothetical protein
MNPNPSTDRRQPASFLSRVLASSLALGVLYFSAGCATGPEIKYETDRSVDVAAYKTFVLIPFSKTAGVTGQGANPGTSLKLAAPLTAAIRSNLTAKGFTEVQSAVAADFAVNVRATIVPQTDVTDWGMGYTGYGAWRYGGYWGGYGGYNVTVDQYNQGVLRIEIFDAKKKELVWVGWASDRVDESPKDAEARLNSVVAGILANFPPPPPGAEKK